MNPMTRLADNSKRKKNRWKFPGLHGPPHAARHASLHDGSETVSACLCQKSAAARPCGRRRCCPCLLVVLGFPPADCSPLSHNHMRYHSRTHAAESPLAFSSLPALLHTRTHAPYVPTAPSELPVRRETMYHAHNMRITGSQSCAVFCPCELACTCPALQNGTVRREDRSHPRSLQPFASNGDNGGDTCTV